MINLHQLQIDPNDGLYFGDHGGIPRPGINDGDPWPLPTGLHNALLAAMHERWPERQQWEFHHPFRALPGSQDKNTRSSLRFGGLKTIGLFPQKDSQWYFPMPADVMPYEGNIDLAKPGNLSTGSGNNLPKPLCFNLIDPFPPTRHNPEYWLSRTAYQYYLQGHLNFITTPANELYFAEHHSGYTYSSQTSRLIDQPFHRHRCIRLQPGVSMAGVAECIAIKHNPGIESGVGGRSEEKEHEETAGRNSASTSNANRARTQTRKTATDVLQCFLAEGKAAIAMGGRRTMAYVRHAVVSQYEMVNSIFPKYPNRNIYPLNIKWVLLTPAIFRIHPIHRQKSLVNQSLPPEPGWLPDWVDHESGAVKLPSSYPPRRVGEKRQDWHRRFQAIPPINARLVAARINPPLTLSGLKLDAGHVSPGRPKPTYRAVPAGSVYYFQAATTSAAGLLFDALNCCPRSAIMGEKGWGVGVCGIWNENQPESSLLS